MDELHRSCSQTLGVFCGSLSRRIVYRRGRKGTSSCLGKTRGVWPSGHIPPKKVLRRGPVSIKTKLLSTIMFVAVQFAPCLIAQTSPQKRQEASFTTTGLTNDDVATLLKAGLTSEIVIAKINSSACDFNTSTTNLQELKAGGVPDAVILAMVQASKGL